jgi:hypothetical protein
MNFDVYTRVVDEKFMFLGIKMGVILVERGILDRLLYTLDKSRKVPYNQAVMTNLKKTNVTGDMLLDQWQKIVFTTIMARNASSILSFGYSPKYEKEAIDKVVIDEVRKKLQDDDLGIHLEIFEYTRLPMMLFFDIIDTGVGYTASHDSIDSYYNHFKVNFNEFKNSGNFVVKDNDGTYRQPHLIEFEETMFGYFLPSVIIHQAAILDQMVKTFFQMNDFIDQHGGGPRFVEQYNKASGALRRLCSMVAYTHQRNIDFAKEEQEVLATNDQIMKMSNYIFDHTDRKLFQESPWCRLILKMNSESRRIVNREKPIKLEQNQNELRFR